MNAGDPTTALPPAVPVPDADRSRAELLAEIDRLRHLLEPDASAAELARTQEALRASEERFRQLAENIPEVFWLTEGSRLIYLSPAYEIIWGRTCQSLYDDYNSYRSYIHPDDLPVLDAFIAGIGQGILQPAEYRIIRPDGSIRWVATRCFPVANARGEIYRMAGISVDITARKEEEARLAQLLAREEAAHAAAEKAREAAEAASRAKSQFLANMSHEIRTPLNGVLGMAQLLAGTPLAPEQQEYLETIHSSGTTLLALLNDILDFSKIEAGRLDIEFAPFDLRECAADAIKAVGVRAAEKGLELIFDFRPGVPEAVVGDAVRLRQVLLNLVGNAVKFTAAGQVVLGIEPTGGPGDGQGLHFWVSDTGAGIPADKQEAIFEAFTQADGSTTRRYGGSGLGLAIARRLVELMGGRLWLESSPSGSTFHFSAHFGVSDLVSSALPPPAPTRLVDVPVLIADDNATNRRILEAMAAGWKMRPTAVADGAAALAALEAAQAAEQRFALLLLDVNMPGLDGFAVAERVRALAGVARTPIIMLTSAGRPEETARCRDLGVAAYLVKPVQPSDLLGAVVRSLGFTPLGIRRQSAPPTKEPEPAGPPLRILLAEDNVINQRLAVRLLEKRGHQVVVAATGLEVLDLLDRTTVDLVLMDVQMPEMNGLEATARIREREQHRGGHVPIVALTAHAIKGDRERCLAAGMDGYVAKPVQPEELFAAIAAAVGTAGRSDAQ